jgi:predicted MFS family arabinose efflux permease
MPIFASDVLHGGARMLGLLMLCAGVGAVNGALHFAARTDYKGLMEWIAATSTTCALGLIVFSQSRTLWLSAVMLVAVGFSTTSQLAATNTILQARVPNELRGRIMAVYATMFMGVQPLGALLAGGVAKRIGAPHALAAFGTVCLLGSLLFMFRAMRLGQTQGAAEPQAGLGR